MEINELEKQSAFILNDAIERYKPSHIFVLFSGGHDSMSTTHFSANILGSRMSGVVHIDTGIGIKETQQYVKDRCEQYGWKLLVYRAVENTKADGTPDPMVYEDLVVRFGFPGGNIQSHAFMYSRLKERQLLRLVREHKVGKEKIMFVSGLRKQESRRRMGYDSPINIDGRQVWVNTLFYWDALQVSDYLGKHNIPRNPVKDYTHLSGECLCGAFAKRGELKEIELWYPEAAANIRRIEKKVIAAGFPWRWEESPPEWYLKNKVSKENGQYDAFDCERDDVLVSNGFMPMCASCLKYQE